MDSVTAVGKPIGEEVTEEIGKDGGTITSDDGRIELIFPQEALNKKKKIKIRAVTNLAANGSIAQNVRTFRLCISPQSGKICFGSRGDGGDSASSRRVEIHRRM